MSELLFFLCMIFISFLTGWRFIFFFKQKTAYEMRISDWSSDVCSSDLSAPSVLGRYTGRYGQERTARIAVGQTDGKRQARPYRLPPPDAQPHTFAGPGPGRTDRPGMGRRQ